MKKLFQSFVLGLASAFALTSCGSSLLPDITSQQDVDALYAAATENFKDANVLKVSVVSDEPLEEGLKHLQVLYKDKEDGKCYLQYVVPSGKISDPDVVMMGERTYAKTPERAFSDFKPFADIKKLKEEAVALSDELSEHEYEGFTLNRLESLSTDNGVERILVLTATKKGETTKREGRRRITTYYEFKWQLLDDGTLEYVED